MNEFPIRILIVEDKPLEAELVQRTLSVFEEILGKPDIIITSSFQTALTYVQGLHPADIVILDPNLDDSTYKQTIKNVRQLEDHSPLFILTGHDPCETRELLEEAKSSHIEVIEKGPAVYTKGFMTSLIARVMFNWHEKRHLPMRESMKILENYQRPHVGT